MQVDRMFTAKAAIIIKQNKKAESDTSIQGKADPARQRLVKILSKAAL